MALSFNGIQPVEFGGKDCMPKLDTETRMRISQIKNYNDEADEVLASAFPDDEIYVREFLRDKMTPLDKQTLQAYLLGGEKMVATVMSQFENAIGGSMKEVLNEK